MTREQAKEILPIIQAFADGKTIQYRDTANHWFDMRDPGFLSNVDKYRVKPDLQYRPFENMDETWEEVKKHEPIGWIKSKSNNANLHVARVECEDNRIYFITASFHGLERFDAQTIFRYFTFMDGAPLGIKEE